MAVKVVKSLFNYKDAGCLCFFSVTSVTLWLLNMYVEEHAECLRVQVQGGRVDMHKVWHVRWSCCGEALRVQLLILLWPTEVYTQPDYMSGLVSPAKQALGCSRVVSTVASHF